MCRGNAPQFGHMPVGHAKADVLHMAGAMLQNELAITLQAFLLAGVKLD
ncbi:MAG TPA: hypothetical protein VGO51_10290 [Burkholderiaceae bacterium]|jgi:hypothetical protein|nr:hypothetical protein [Burkholderiaceae bacterium]